MIYIIVFTVLYIGLLIYVKRYASPWYLYMVIGKKRSGKSTFATMLAYKYIKKGYVVYTNMLDCLVDGVRFIDPNDLDKYAPEKYSVLLLDEAGSLYDNRDFKSFKKGVRDFYIYQGHYKCIVWLFSQAHNVDKKLRDLTDRFFLLQKVMNVLVVAKTYSRTIKTLSADGNPTGELFGEELRPLMPWHWKYIFIPKWIKKFDSFTLPPSLQREKLPYKTRENLQCQDDTGGRENDESPEG